MCVRASRNAWQSLWPVRITMRALDNGRFYGPLRQYKLASYVIQDRFYLIRSTLLIRLFIWKNSKHFNLLYAFSCDILLLTIQWNYILLCTKIYNWLMFSLLFLHVSELWQVLKYRSKLDCIKNRVNCAVQSNYQTRRNRRI